MSRGAGFCRRSGPPMLLGSREQRFNGFVAQDEQCCHGSGPLWNGFVSCGFAYAADDLLTAKLFQIVGSTT